MTAHNTIVKEIHSSFTAAEKELLEEARSILDDAVDVDKKKRAIELARLGFKEAKPVRRLSKEQLEEADSLLYLKCRYERIAPQYKFLTEKKLMSICQEYGIVVGKAERYIGDIPTQNQEDIVNFNILDDYFLEIEEEGYRSARFETNSGESIHPKEMSTEHLYNALSCYKRKLQRHQYMHTRRELDGAMVTLIRTMITELALRQEQKMIDQVKKCLEHDTALSGDQIETLTTPIKNSYFYVAADIDSFNTEGVTLDGNMLREENNDQELAESIKETLFRRYDPIVLAKVQGGYLVVTAWGDEASDPEVVQPRRN